MSQKIKDQRFRSRIYLLPNIFTTAALFAGFYAIVASTQGRFIVAAIAIFVAMVLDNLDGSVARMTNSQSDFGAELDSLADMVSFGLAPALVMYEWALSSMRDYGWYWAKLGWLAAFVYVAGAAIRLARFNTQRTVTDKRFFQGLASPPAAGVMVGLVWLGVDLGLPGKQMVFFAFAITLLCGLLMVSRFPYYSFKEFGRQYRVHYTTMIFVVIGLVCIIFDPAKVLCALFVTYLFSGPFTWAIRRIRKFRRRHEHVSSEESK
ncbi:MAG: CDP-diacylglycerol--serine O-phosphatidyltransferase [Gammaproteobacteria bacterium]|nr:CDP-diacylglycerol--serine O-phosphatidyltransferase [Gammaproteobacteria bacterium]